MSTHPGGALVSAQTCPSGTNWPGASGSQQEGFSHATYYTTPDAGACGYGNLDAAGTGQDIAALSDSLYLYNGEGSVCGVCYEVRCCGSDSLPNACTGDSVTVTVTDRCPNEGNPICVSQPHFDLSTSAFNKIANPVAGIIKIQYKRVHCPRNIAVTLGGWNSGWLEVRFLPTPVWAQFSIDNGPWIDLSHDFGAAFKHSSGPYSNSGTGSVSFKVKNSEGESAELPNCIPSGQWNWGRRYDCGIGYGGGSGTRVSPPETPTVVAPNLLPTPKDPFTTNRRTAVKATFPSLVEDAWHAYLGATPAATTRECKGALHSIATGRYTDKLIKAKSMWTKGQKQEALELAVTSLFLAQSCAVSLQRAGKSKATALQQIVAANTLLGGAIKSAGGKVRPQPGGNFKTLISSAWVGYSTALKGGAKAGECRSQLEAIAGGDFKDLLTLARFAYDKKKTSLALSKSKAALDLGKKCEGALVKSGSTFATNVRASNELLSTAMLYLHPHGDPRHAGNRHHRIRQIRHNWKHRSQQE